MKKKPEQLCGCTGSPGYQGLPHLIALLDKQQEDCDKREEGKDVPPPKAD